MFFVYKDKRKPIEYYTNIKNPNQYMPKKPLQAIGFV
ncbi:hypothetical protein N007_07425 [Alicyclobacillus acidoterrestris ATCC 49025]|nr:hypothetical protein N007_07425 [Alicyclobacillus acidoterrestris ATCC 49025]